MRDYHVWASPLNEYLVYAGPPPEDWEGQASDGDPYSLYKTACPPQGSRIFARFDCDDYDPIEAVGLAYNVQKALVAGITPDQLNLHPYTV
jgi:hypothetical protein